MTDTDSVSASGGSPQPGGAADPFPLPRGFAVLLTAAAAIILIAGFRSFSSSIGPIFLALVIVVVVSPVQRRLINRGVPSWIAMLVLLVASYGVLLAILLALVWSTTELVGLLSGDRYDDEISSAREQIEEWLQEFELTEIGFDEALDALDPGAVVGQITSAVSSLLSLTSAVGLLVITMLFMVLDAQKFGDNLARVAGERPDVARALGQFAKQTRSYFIVSTVFGLIVAVLDVAVLMALGIPLAVVWGVLSLITNYIPNVGFVIGLIPPAILAFFEGGWQLSVWVIVSYLAINIVIQSIIQPKFVGDAVGLSTTLTFLSLIFWGWVLGPLGALLAVPITLLVKALLVDIDPTTRWAAPLISLGPSIDDELPVAATAAGRPGGSEPPGPATDETDDSEPDDSEPDDSEPDEADTHGGGRE
ncbi:MAG: AI-2E family transporter, partial [Actinomycetota bacterium]